jgi:tight adherence protein C
VEWVLPILAFAVVFLAVIAFAGQSSTVSLRLARHTAAVAGSAAAKPKGPSLRDRIVHGRFGRMVTNNTKGEVKQQAALLLQRAGVRMPVTTYILIRSLLLLVATPLVGLVVWQLLGISLITLAIIAVAGLVLPRLPALVLQRKAKARGAAIERGLPDALDLLVVCIEGGLSLDGGLLQVAERTRGPVAEELARLKRDMAAGMARRDAFMAMAQRSPSESLAIVASTITQADKMGMSIGTTLRTLAETMRMRRRQAAEEKARKAPVKMMPVLIVFMIPSMFVVILGSAVMAIMELM